MRNDPIGDVRPTTALTTFAAYTRARGARRAPDSARAVEMAAEIGGVTHTVWRRRGGEGCGAHRRDRTDPHQPPVRRGERAACAGCRRFPVGHWVSG